MGVLPKEDRCWTQIFASKGSLIPSWQHVNKSAATGELNRNFSLFIAEHLASDLLEGLKAGSVYGANRISIRFWGILHDNHSEIPYYYSAQAPKLRTPTYL